MNLPEAFISHRTGERLRIRIPSRKGDAQYFSSLEKGLGKGKGIERLEANSLTGSVLFVGEKVDADYIQELGGREGLFQLTATDSPPTPLSKKVAAPIGTLDRRLGRFTGGEVDLAGIAFVGLLGAGLYQIVSGNFRSPPWYTAFWYALGVFSKTLADKSHPS